MTINIPSIINTIYYKIIKLLVSSIHGSIAFYQEPDRWNIIKQIKIIKNEKRMLIEENEAYQIYMAIKQTKKIPGDIAEVGVYQGGSAKLICLYKKDKTLHLFDTFTGLPNISNKDDEHQFNKGLFSTHYSAVKKYLKKYSNIYFYKGIFPNTAKTIKNKKFSFVHLDVDIYQSTIDSLKFFYPRLNKGGIIISHDYANAIGVKQAFKEFFKSLPEPIIEMSGSQCLIVKM